ncbi:hypothetical protein VF14_02955 [Nostoc linckia z18]|uniref:Uncharacterized protein n=2 Tax=Nostoc linckia TaxID=92942 RepID=A0A9Q5ZH59_NOSLI|nr:hypothetical protein [Nostoc linckia]PHK42343.1 hypothetical protein VF12_02970 [Nostoc linckia z15]PHK46784.1 hypothetical protein VF13_08840 [Nostoc linckia z16]PHJ69113.1 hypothetical protein VF02_00425 [Nostoc linckia z1]PHJ73264.1 hypothetical protein VF05_01440 [Nostoc linckia z3]PHJ78611.1 hypothetical protein VF03_00425 [Nostoc linckia z2]
MSKLNVIHHQGQLVVDSRLIAQELGIDFELLDELSYLLWNRSVEYLSAFDLLSIWLIASYDDFAVKTREAELAPQTQELIEELLTKFEQQNRVIEEQGKAIALLQSQIQNLLPISAYFMPPGWDAHVWEKLLPQDKRHFKYLYRRRGFRPGNEAEVKLLPLSNRASQLAEIEHLINDVPESEKELIETGKRVALQRFWAQFGGES